MWQFMKLVKRSKAACGRKVRWLLQLSCTKAQLRRLRRLLLLLLLLTLLGNTFLLFILLVPLLNLLLPLLPPLPEGMARIQLHLRLPN